LAVIRLLVGCGVVVVVLSVAPAAPVPKGAEKPLYFPTKVGAKWVYEWRYGKENESSEVVEIVTAVESGKGGAKVVTVGRVPAKGKAYPTRKFEVSDRGLFQTENLIGRSLRRPCCSLKLPHTPGQTWDVFSDSGVNIRHTAHGPERVKVPAGEFECIRIEYRDERSPDPNQTRWYAPGVGEVKADMYDQLITLKSFTPGKD
jgi:hypothetical protein